MAFLEDTAIVLISQVSSNYLRKFGFLKCFYRQIFFFCGGLVFFVKQLFKNYEIKNISIQLIFSITFALSLTLFELIIFEIAGVLESSSRFFHWRLALIAILVMVVAVIPYYIAHSLISNIRIGKMSVSVVQAEINVFLISFSAKSLFNVAYNNSMAWLSVLLLADRRPIPTVECEPRYLLHRAGGVKDWSRRCYSNGDSLGLRCCQLSILQHDLLHPSCNAKRCPQHRTTVDADDGHDLSEEEENCA